MLLLLFLSLLYKMVALLSGSRPSLRWGGRGRQTDRQTHRHTDTQTDTQTDRQTHTHINRDTQTDTYIHRHRDGI